LQQSFKAKYASKLITNFFGLLLGVLVTLIIPKTLGAESYGKYEFIVTNFRTIIAFLTFSIPTAFFVWVSMKHQKINISYLTGIHLYGILGVSVLLLLLISISIIFNFQHILWPEIENNLIYFGCLFSLGFFLIEFFTYISDGVGLTITTEIIKATHKLVRGLFIILLLVMGILTLKSFIISDILLYLLFIALILGVILKKKILTIELLYPWKIDKLEFSEYRHFSKGYVLPLIYLTFATFFQELFDRWFLQWVGGSVEQGFFGLSFRLSALAIIFTSAATPILMREFAIAYDRNDFQQLKKLFDKRSLFLFISIITAFFFAFNVDEIIDLLGKEEYQNARIPILLMAFYPVHQTLGQINGSFLMSTGKTKLYSSISIVAQLAGIPVTFLLINSTDSFLPGLQLGSLGLVIKMLAVQLIATNVQLFFISKMIQGSFISWTFNQVKLLGVGYIIYLVVYLEITTFASFINITDIFENDSLNAFAKIAFSGILFLINVGFVVLFLPRLIGFNKDYFTKMLFKR
jgi:O-antigen/teichoic acid export membrane protein